MRIEIQTARWLIATLLIIGAGTAVAASIESLVMPGPVIEGHADLEESCSNCHDVFDRSSQQRLCLDCHEPVAADLLAGSGYHGLDENANGADCKQCHTEHKGREADITGLQSSLFDHKLTDFPLNGAHEAQSCSACHQPDTRHAEAPNECAGCHEADDVHGGLLTSACADCHETESWRTADFDHGTTEFALEGKHADTTCLGCHESQLFEPPGNLCSDCHQLDDVHGGSNGTACGDCHGAESWDTSFDHQQETGFALVGAHDLLSCQNCHVDTADGYEELPTDCNGCHNGEDVHLGSNGTSCGDCHEQNSWETSFNHLQETGYDLLGAHQPLNCSACHSNGLEAPIAVDCIGCHEAEDPHNATLDECDSCHGQTSWDEDQRFHHDLAEFALMGLHRTVSCEQCHDSLTFSPLPHQCSDCHIADDNHQGVMGEACESCHNPAGWDYWLFDHGSQTNFSLTGAHENLACVDCHAADTPATRQSQACASCHRSDDIHKGRFGQNCDRCHLGSSFKELKSDI